MAVSLAKAALRGEIKQCLSAMTPEERCRQSKLVTAKVLESSIYQKSKRVCVYLSMDHEEVSTKDILIDIFSSGKQCFVPRYTKSEMQMLRLCSLIDYESLPLTKWNIKQPSGSDNREEALSSGGLDLILVPGLAFTTDGRRLGRGKGYYDIYLKKCIDSSNSNSLVSIALAFKEQVVGFIPTTNDDILVNHVFHA